jgi:DNA-binding MarR family transcriptional regulator
VKKKTFRETPAAPPHPTKKFVPPLSISHPQLLVSGSDARFREMIHLMVLAFGRLQSFREAFGRAIALTGSQFIVLIATARQQGTEGVSIRALSDHTHLAATHVTTEVGKLIGMGLLIKSANMRDRRGVLVRLSPNGEAAIHEVTPFVRRVNDLLFQRVTARDFAIIMEFLSLLALNTEYATAEIRRSELERDAHSGPRKARRR